MNTLIVITGPTAVGKTELCLEIAKTLGIPIINADSRQMYKGMAIGTAAPTASELDAVKHYFVGNLQLDDYYNAAIYEQEVISLLGQLFRQSQESHCDRHGGMALLSGGSMMYIDAVCYGIDDIPTITQATRTLVKERLEREGLESLCADLEKLDPEYYKLVDKKNIRRIVHGLEICLQTGCPYSSFRKQSKKTREFRTKKIALERPREELYSRINTRVENMMAAGLLQEAQALYPMRHLNALNTVGYKELFGYFDGNYSLDEAVERIKGSTRRYARKQLTWLKRDTTARWYSPDDIDAIMKYIFQV